MANEVKFKLAIDGAQAVSQQLGSVGKSFDAVGTQAATAMKALGGMMGGFSAALTIGKLVSVQREFDVLNSSLITVTGSSAAAAREMAWIKTFAKETPFGLAQATQGFVKMKAMGLDPSRAALTSFGNTASAMGKDLNQMIEAVADASTGEFERLKEFGIKASKQGDDVSLTFQGVTTTIGNNSKEINGYLEALGNNEFAGAMARRAETLDGAIAALADTWDELFFTVSSKNAASLMTDSVTVATKAIEDAITIINSMSSAADANAKSTGAMATVQEGIAIVFETVAVLGADVKYVLVGIGSEIGGLAAQAVQVLQGNFAGAAAIRGAMVADAARARKELDSTTAAIMTAREHAKTADTVNAQASARLARQSTEAVTGLAAAHGKVADAATKGAAAAKAAASEHEKAYKSALDAAQKLADIRNKESAAIEDYMAAESLRLLQTAHGAEEAVRLAQEEFDNHGKLKSEIAATTLTRLQDQLVTHTAGTEAYDSLTRQINAQKQLIGIMRNGEMRDAGEKAATDLLASNKKAAEESGKYWEDALMRAFESGKGFFQSLWDTIKNTLKTQVLKVLVTGVVGSVTGYAGAQGAGGSGLVDYVNGASNLNTLYGAGSQAIYGGVAGASNASLMYANATQLAGGDGLGALISANGGWAGVGIGTTGAGGVAGLSAAALTLAETNTAIAVSLGATATEAGAAALAAADAAAATAAGASTISGALTAIGPVGWATIGVAALAAIFSGGGETRSGATYDTGADGLARYQQGPSGGEIAADTARAIFNITKTSIQDILKLVGSKAAVTGFTAGLESSEDGKGFAFAGGYVDGKSFGDSAGRDGYASGQWAYQTMSNEQAMAAYVNELKKSTLEALQAATDIPKLISDQLTGVDINSLNQEGLDKTIDALFGPSGVITQVNGFVAQINTGGIEQLHDLGFAAAAGLMAASGGLENLVANINTYYSNFYTAEEQRLQTIKNINAATAGSGLDAATATRESFRAIVESQDLTTASGQATYAALLGVSGAFAGLTPLVENTATSTDALAKSAADAAAALAKTNQGWLDQLDILTGAETDRSIALRDATDDSTRAIMRQVYAQEDLKAIAEQRTALENTLLELQGNTVALRNRELAALDPSNRALQNQIYALQDAKTAQEAYTTALTSAESRFNSATSALKSAQDAVASIRDKATSSYVSAQDKVADANKRIADVQLEALKATEKAAQDAAKKLQELGKTLSDFVSEKTTTADQNFASTLKKALAGDTEAMAGLTNAATAASELAAERSGNVALAQARIMADVMSVAKLAGSAVIPTATAEADPRVAAAAALTAAQADMADALRVVTEIGASTTKSVLTLIGEYSTAVQAMATAQTEYSAAKQVLEDIKTNTGATKTSVDETKTAIDGLKEKFTIELALAATTSVTDYLTVHATALTTAQRDTALAVLDGVTRTIDLVADAIKESERDTALAALVGVSRTVKIVAKALTSTQRDTAVAILDRVTRTIGLSVSSLTSTQRDSAISVLNNISVAVGLTASAVTAAQADTALATLSNLTKSVALSVTDFSTADAKIITDAAAGVTKTVTAALGAGNADALTLAKASSDTITKTLAAALGTTDTTALTLLGASSTTVTRTLSASGGVLTADQKSILGAVAAGSASVSASVSGTVTWDPNAATKSVFDSIALTNLYIKSGMLHLLQVIVGKTFSFNDKTGAVAPSGSLSGYALLSQLMLSNGDVTRAQLTYANGGAFVGGVQAFAGGGTFTNTIASSPTLAPMALFGEAGPEAIMPLTRDGQGRLGVTAQMPDLTRYGRGDSSGALVAEIRRLRESNERLEQHLANIEAATNSSAASNARTADSTRRMDTNGVLVYTDPAEPLNTKTEALPA